MPQSRFVHLISVADATERLLNAVHDCNRREDLLRSILAEAVGLLGADRGDFALQDTYGRLILKVSFGPATNSLTLERELPGNTFIRSVFESSEPGCHIVNDATTLPNQRYGYHQAHPRVKRVACTRFAFRGGCAGALNVESFKNNPFDATSGETLERLGKFAAICLQIFDEQSRIQQLVDGVLADGHVQGRSDLQSILDDILEVAHEVFGVPHGLIFLYNEHTHRLECLSGRVKEEIGDFSYGLSTKSIATHVFQTTPDYFTSNVDGDRYANRKGISKFGIRGPLVAVRLVRREKPVGVLVGWGDGNIEPTEDHPKILAPLATLGGFSLAMWSDGEALAKRMSQLSSLVGLLPFCIVGKDENGTITYCNERFRNYIGNVKEEEVIGKSDAAYFPKKQAEKFRRDDRKVMKQKRIMFFPEMNTPTRTGIKIRVNTIKAPIWEGGEVIGVQCIFATGGDVHLIENLGEVLGIHAGKLTRLKKYKTAKKVNLSKQVGASTQHVTPRGFDRQCFTMLWIAKYGILGGELIDGCAWQAGMVTSDGREMDFLTWVEKAVKSWNDPRDAGINPSIASQIELRRRMWGIAPAGATSGKQTKVYNAIKWLKEKPSESWVVKNNRCYKITTPGNKQLEKML